jgi:hypothetical protein
MTRALPSSLAHQFSVACSLINIATSIGPYIVEFAKSHLACLRIPIWSVLLSAAVRYFFGDPSIIPGGSQRKK